MSARLRQHAPLAVTLAAALAYRLLLTTRYYGWEESDYGNLAMARGVLDSHFTHFDMAHLPLYYGLSAAVLAVVDDAIVATRVVAMGSGLIAIALTWLIAARLTDRTVATAAAILLAFQPEFALYASTALREPLYTCLWVAGLALVLSGRAAAATACMGGAFLTRFDALFTGVPTVLFHLATRPGRRGVKLRQLGISLGVAAAFVGGWSLYCGLVHGDYLFLRSTVQVNVETGGAQEIVTRGAFIAQGLGVALAMATEILPRKLGWPLWLGALAFIPLMGRRAWRNPELRTLTLAWLINTAFWLTVGFFAQHEPNHNLYWKWMYILVPFWVMLGAWSWVTVCRRAPRALAVALATLAVAATAWAFQAETRAQLDMSERLYKPQVDVARFIEEEVPPGTAMILDNIPACYLDRRHHDFDLRSWFDLEITPGDPDALAAYIEANHIAWVLWFKEDWTTAPTIAPYLATVATHPVGRFQLVPRSWELEYGFIFYRVEPQP